MNVTYVKMDQETKPFYSSTSGISALRSMFIISPKCRSCSGLRYKLPGEFVLESIEKFAVVGDILPLDDIDRLAACVALDLVESGSTNVGDDGEVEFEWERDCGLEYGSEPVTR